MLWCFGFATPMRGKSLDFPESPSLSCSASCNLRSRLRAKSRKMTSCATWRSMTARVWVGDPDRLQIRRRQVRDLPRIDVAEP